MQWPEPLWETPNESILTSRSSLKEVSCGVVFSVPKTHIPRWYGATKGDSSDVTTMMLVVTRARQTTPRPTEVKHHAPHNRPPPRSIPWRPRLARVGEDLPEPLGSDPRCGPRLVENRAYYVLEERREGCGNPVKIIQTYISSVWNFSFFFFPDHSSRRTVDDVFSPQKG